MNMLDLAVAVFIGNMITVAWAFSLNHIIKASNEGRKQSPWALWSFVGLMGFAMLAIANV